MSKGRAIKSLLLGLTLLSCATSAEAGEVWTCTDPEAVNEPMLFEISPPDVIMAPVVPQGDPMRFHIVRNDDKALVATGDDAEDALTVWTVAINKVSGEFGLALFPAMATRPMFGESITNGKCVKD